MVDHTPKLEPSSSLAFPPIELSRSFHLASYPHILSSILDYSSQYTLTTVARCSRAMHQAAVRKLYRTLRVTAEQLGALVDIGYQPSSQTSSNGAKPTFSPTLQSCLQSVRTLYLLEFEEEKPLPTLPDECLTRVVNVCLELDEGYFVEELELPPMFSSMAASHLFIRHDLCHICELDGGNCVTTIYNLPPSFRQVTMLVPLSYLLPGAPACEIEDGDTPLERRITVVLLPWDVQAGADPDDDFHVEREKSMPQRWNGRSAPASYRSPKYPIHFVGAAYAGHCTEQVRLLVPDHTGKNISAAARTISFGLFSDWLDANEGLFAEWEHGEMWREDIALVAHRVREMCDIAMDRTQARAIELLNQSGDIGKVCSQVKTEFTTEVLQLLDVLRPSTRAHEGMGMSQLLGSRPS